MAPLLNKINIMKIAKIKIDVKIKMRYELTLKYMLKSS
jgi:hypothetical protein